VQNAAIKTFKFFAAEYFPMLKEQILDLLEKDREFRYAVAG